MYLRQSTSHDVTFGPFVDDTDFKTIEDALTITQSDMQLSKDAGAFAQKSAAGNASHLRGGEYRTTLSATDTNTVGWLHLQVQVAGALPVWKEWQVISADAYDAIYGAGAPGPVRPTTPANTLDVNAAGQSGVDLANVSGVLGNANVSWVDGSNRIDLGQWLGVAPLALAAQRVQTDVQAWGGVAGAVKVNGTSGLPETDTLAVGGVTVTGPDDLKADVTNLDVAVSSRASPADVATALSDIHLDHLFAVDYDPALPPGVATAWANELTENDGAGVIRFTAIALEQAPTGGGGGDWTVGEREQIRYRLQMDGAQTAPAAHAPAQLQTTAQVVADKDGYTLSASGIDAIWDELAAGHTVPGSFGSFLDASVSSRSAHSAADVWAVATRSLTEDVTVGGYAGGQSPNDALVVNHLDHLFAVDYDPASIPGVAGAWINELSENDGAGGIRYTAKALEQAPTGGGGGLTEQQVRDAMKLAPSVGAPAAGSIDLHLDDIQGQTDQLAFTGGAVDANTAAINGIAVTGPDDLKADVSNLDVAVSTRAAPGALMGIVAGGITPVEAPNLDAAISSRSTFDPTAVVPESYAANGAAFTFEQALYGIYANVAQYDIVGTTLTARRLDGLAAAMTFTLDDAVNPTSRVRAT